VGVLDLEAWVRGGLEEVGCEHFTVCVVLVDYPTQGTL
jgi:hypothetical protein